MKFKSGFSIMEVMIAFVIFGVLLVGMATLFSNFEKENASLHRRIQAATFESNIMLAMKSSQLLRELIVDLPRNSVLKTCLERGCQIGTNGPVEINRTLDWAYRNFDFSASFLMVGDDLAELKLELLPMGTLSYPRKFSVYIPRRDFLKLPDFLGELRCPRGQYINGVRYITWSPICERK